MIAVIPCYNESETTTTLDSLLNCTAPNAAFKVIVVVNQSEITSEEVTQRNLQTISELKEWKVNHPDFPLEILEELSLPKKHAGVGLARKIGMDEAVHLFHQSQTDGIIVALDSDCVVDKNYLQEIEAHFNQNPNTPGCSIRYAHPIQGENENINIGIIQYELHLRYYNQALKWAGFPFAFHTVGSSMAVRSSAYQKQGGMNKRKAGEDFYFLQKIIELGGFTELNTTCVIPSPRISDRVPFGTGKAIGDFIESKELTYYTYQFETFRLLAEIPTWLKQLFEGNKKIHSNSKAQEFLDSIQFENKVEEIKNNTSSFSKFEKRFYTFFNAFTVLKFTHFMRDHGLPNRSIIEEAKLFLRTVSKPKEEANLSELLTYYRQLDRE